MSIKAPTPKQIRTVADDLGLSLSADDVAEFGAMMTTTLGNYYAPLDRLPDNLPEVAYPRTPGHRPGADEDPLHAWYVKTSIKGAESGKLADKRVVLKDNVCLAGVPMMNGASTLEGYVPDVDATIVTRILDAGGEIVGKAHCRVFLFFRRQPHQRHRCHPQPAQARLFGRRLVVGLRGAGRRRRGRDGDRRRPRRFDPCAFLVLRRLRHEGDARAGALHRGDADRADAGSRRADDHHRRRQRFAAGSDRRTRRTRPAPIFAPAGGLHRGARAGR